MGDISFLVKLLNGENLSLQSDAAEALGKLGDAQAVPHLIEALMDKDPQVREKAVWALGQLGDAQAVPHLTEILKSKESQTKEKVAEALLRIYADDILSNIEKYLGT